MAYQICKKEVDMLTGVELRIALSIVTHKKRLANRIIKKLEREHPNTKYTTLKVDGRIHRGRLIYEGWADTDVLDYKEEALRV